MDVDRFAICPHVELQENWFHFLGWNEAIKTVINGFFFVWVSRSVMKTQQNNTSRNGHTWQTTVKEVLLTPTLNYLPFPIWTVMLEQKMLESIKKGGKKDLGQGLRLQ